MKLRNKNTGEIATLTLSSNGEELLLMKNNEMITRNMKLSELEEWEDYEEQKEYWYIDYDGGILCGEKDNSSAERMMISMGNHFESLEEAEKAVEKLKAWKRLKDKGIVIRKLRHNENGGEMYWSCPSKTGISDKQIWLDLDLLFGGEE
jgi:hypothetical protein